MSPPAKLVTLNRHIQEEQRLHPEATGEFTRLLDDFLIAIKLIRREVSRAGLIDILGFTGGTNVHGEEVKKLDAFAQDRIFKGMDHGGHLCCMASEEEEELIRIPDPYKRGNYVLLFDPLDGSSNIDANVTIGTIFSIQRRVSGPAGSDGKLEDCLQPGRRQVCSGYVVYGSSTMVVYTAGHGVHGFTLDPSVGEFILSHENIRTPARGRTYSINEGNVSTWDEPTRRYISHLKQKDPATKRPYGLRYIGSLVADFHRNLLYGGIFLYPADLTDPAKPKPKLRLLYEANPLAMIVEQAGGLASTGRERILDIQPTALHQRVPLILGCREDVEEYEAFVQGRR